MKNNFAPKNIFSTTTSYLYIFLFSYAAVSKLIDFNTFVAQIGQSPLLSAYAEAVAVLVPTVEIAIAIALSITTTRYVGLLAAFGLMVMFTIYIIIILNYSAFIPCSCGGILSDLNWTQHLLFNIVCCFLALAALFLHKRTQKSNTKKTLLQSLLVASLGTSMVIILFLTSEEEMHRNNSFLRRYPHHPIKTIKGIPINFNSYYIAGFSKGKIYLGNITAPLHLLEVDTLLKKKKAITLKIADNKNHNFTTVQVRVNETNFFIFDGNVPVIYEGLNTNWTAKTSYKGKATFAALEPTTSNSFVCKGNDSLTGQNLLGIIHQKDTPQHTFFNNVLQKKIDGIFDTDGVLMYNEDLKKVIYTYYYRNTFITTDKDLKDVRTHKTIDTVTQVPLEFTYIHKTEKKLAKPPAMINKYATSSGKYLFIKSDRLGKYESKELAKQASIIDVYDLQKQTYEFSFYLYHYKKEEVKSFKIYNNMLIGLTKNHLITAELKPTHFKLKTQS